MRREDGPRWLNPAWLAVIMPALGLLAPGCRESRTGDAQVPQTTAVAASAIRLSVAEGDELDAFTGEPLRLTLAAENPGAAVRVQATNPPSGLELGVIEQHGRVERIVVWDVPSSALGLQHLTFTADDPTDPNQRTTLTVAVRVLPGG